MQDSSNANETVPPINDEGNLKPTLSGKLTNELTIDEALESSGSCGRFQCVIQILFTYIIITVGYQSVLPYFIADDPPWKCVSKNTSNFCKNNFEIDIQNDNENFHRRCKLRRDEWTYSRDQKYSFVTEFDLVCEETSLAALTSGIFHLGGAIGVCVSGIAADKYGRKYILFVCVIMTAASSIACSYVTNTVQLIITRILLGATGWSSYNIVFVYMGEFVVPKYRTISSNILGMGFSMSELVIDVIAYYCRGWRKLQLYLSFPSLIALVFLTILPESPRWVLVNSKKIKAETTLEMIGKFNGNRVSSVSLKRPTIINERKGTYLDLIRNQKLLLLTLALGFIWFTAEMSFYVILFESSNLGGNMYQSLALSSLAEMPSNFATMYALNRFGRKRCVLFCLVMTGVLSGSTMLIPHTFPSRYVLKMILLMLAKFFVFSSILGCFTWTFEVFPTAFRLQGWGSCIALKRMGSFTSPFLTTVLQQYNPVLPYVTVMVLALLSAAGGLIIPETNKMSTRERFDDIFEKPSEYNSRTHRGSKEGNEDIEENGV